jgi:hypothetical protein
MKKKITLALIVVVAVVAMSFDILSSAGKAGRTGAYTEGDCTACHGDYTVNSGSGSIAISASPSLTNGWVPGTKYTVTVTVSQTGVSLFGFDFEALTNATTNGGTISTITGKTDMQTMTSSTRLDAVHTKNGGATANTHAFAFYWTAPAGGTGLVTFYAAGMAANGDTQTSGDYVYTTAMPVQESTTGIAENAASNFNLSVFPNPSSDYLNVKFSLKETSSVTLDLIDISGKKVANLISDNGMNGNINKTFEVSSCSKGVYFVELKINDKTSLQKIVVK